MPPAQQVLLLFWVSLKLLGMEAWNVVHSVASVGYGACRAPYLAPCAALACGSENKPIACLVHVRCTDGKAPDGQRCAGVSDRAFVKSHMPVSQFSPTAPSVAHLRQGLHAHSAAGAAPARGAPEPARQVPCSMQAWNLAHGVAY